MKDGKVGLGANIRDQSIHGVLHLSMYKFEPHPSVPSLSLQNPPHHDDYQSAES
jgi:hypothetical protein